MRQNREDSAVRGISFAILAQSVLLLSSSVVCVDVYFPFFIACVSVRLSEAWIRVYVVHACSTFHEFKFDHSRFPSSAEQFLSLSPKLPPAEEQLKQSRSRSQKMRSYRRRFWT